MAGCGCEVEIKNNEQKQLLFILLAINGSMFVVELIAGIMGQSAGLIADSFDMLADSFVYIISIYAVGKAYAKKQQAARLSGYFQIILGSLLMLEIIRRFIMGHEPESSLMIIISFIALIANVICLALINKHKKGEIHMRASWIFSKNDVIANTGVIIAGFLVYFFNSPWPDLLIGVLIVAVVIRGGLMILSEAKKV
ncbi:cation transporter [sulfur-oxidizing endosymbiont of Gigantopelta aegis]|uniref:cation transporter n=1 Tax=sulfur-oxidizing endosymbiont of Gigantopelta aegis TaxID=2794934 RepID=UPI0018DEBD31|nr:cation transporter [sulfur-oxidizing endosymbiont of Gigantopelta aegis]